MKLRKIWPLLLFPVLLQATEVAHAQFAVIDVASVAQLVAQLQTLEQQLQTARGELAQAQAHYQAITGARGMERLLSGVQRNYLPADWGTLSALPAGAGYPGLAMQVSGALGAESALSAQQLGRLAPAAAAQLQAQRQNAALLQGLSRVSLANASARFSALQQLIASLGQAADEKASLDLAARIGAENAMLQHEMSQVQMLTGMADSEERIARSRDRERQAEMLNRTGKISDYLH